jgi:Cu/Ag efflux protein CusF
MTRSRIRTRSSLACAALVALAALALSASACNKGAEAPAATYTVQGELKSLPQPDGDAVLYVHHEAIPEFVNRQGQKTGMASMSMPFGVPEGVSLEGLAPGDKVELTFAVHWDQNPATQVAAIRKLPADTQLELSGL